MKMIHRLGLAGLLLMAAQLLPTVARAQEDVQLPAWAWGYWGGPRICDATDADGWCIAWHWELKVRDDKSALRRHAAGQAITKLKRADAALNFRPAQPKVYAVQRGEMLELQPDLNQPESSQP